MTTSTDRSPATRRSTTSRDADLPGSSALRPDISSVVSPIWRRPVVLGLGLLLLYVALSFALSPNGYLSTDVGGKTAALAGMAERGDWSTDMGYWAESSDPEGAVFPYAHTFKTENGWWVNTTSIPMVLAARPLWQLGGAQLILLLPMLSAVGAAVVAGRIQSRLDGSDGFVATLVVGVATPVAVYALDFWEHAPGLFLMALGSLSVIKAVEGLGARHGVAAGAWFGLAATMRQEALVYGFVAGVVMTVALSLSARSMADRPTSDRIKHLLPSVGMAIAAIAAIGVSVLVETAYYGTALRSGRSTQAASAAAGLDDASSRLAVAFTTGLSPINGGGTLVYLLGGMLFIGLVWLGIAAERDREIQMPALMVGIVGLALAVRFVAVGPDFVSGLVPTTTLAVVGAVFGLRQPRLRLVAAMALVALPVVFATQYTAGAGPQWGGRYLLLTGYLLTICGCVGLAGRHRALLRGLVAAGIVVTAGGVWFASLRTNAVADDMDRIEAFADGDVVVWFDPVIAREGGPAIVEQRWLTTWADARASTTLEVLAAESIDRFVYIDHPSRQDPSFDGFVVVGDVGTETLEFFERRLTTFERTDAGESDQ